MRVISLILLIVSLTFGGGSHAYTNSLNTSEKIQKKLNYFLRNLPKEYSYTLKNGLKVIAIPYSHSNVARFEILYHVGANDEYAGVTGISHVVEHMIFRGTTHHTRSEYDQIFTSSAADANAETSREYTSYYTTTTLDNLPHVFDLEADRMHNALFNPEDFKKEIEVVKEEQRQRADVDAILLNRIMASAFISSASHNPIIGWIHDLNKINASEAKAWYQRWYHPNNAVIIVCGHIEPSKIFALAETFFGNIPSTPINRQENSEINPIGKKTVEIHFPRASPGVQFYYALPDYRKMNMREIAALSVLSDILNLRLKKKTPYFTSLSSSYDATLLHSSFSINSTFTSEDYQERINQITNYVDMLKQETPVDKTFEFTEQDLLDDKNWFLSTFIELCDDIDTLSIITNSREQSLWSYKDQTVFYYKLTQISLADLHEVARKYLTENNLTIGLIKNGDPNQPPKE